jgi:hypothetical protein
MHVSPTSSLHAKAGISEAGTFCTCVQKYLTYLQDEGGKEIGSLLRGKVQPSSVNLGKMDTVAGPQRCMSLKFSSKQLTCSLLAPPSTTGYKLQISFQPISASDSLAESCLRGTPMITR